MLRTTKVTSMQSLVSIGPLIYEKFIELFLFFFQVRNRIG